MKKYFLLLLSCIFISCAGVVQAATFKSQETVVVDQPITDDVFAAGEAVRIEAPVTGELFMAGGKLTLKERGSRSVFMAGDELTIENGAGYNLFAAGRRITVKGTIEHDAYIAGEEIIIDPSTVIKGTLRVAGNTVTLSGTVFGDVFAGANRLTSTAVIAGAMKADASTLRFEGGSIGKDLTYKVDQEAEGLDKVTVSGKTEHQQRESRVRSAGDALARYWLWSFLTALVTGAALLLLVPTKIRDAAETVRRNWGQAFLIGFLSLVATPVVFFFLISSFVGWPIAFILIAAFIISLYLAGIMGQLFIGDFVLRLLRVGQHNWWGALIVGTLLVSLVKLIPIVGWLIMFLLFVGITLPMLGASLLWWKNKLS